MDLIAWIPMIVQAASTIKGIVDAANTNDSIISSITKALPSLAGVLETIGGALFPKVKPQLRIAAAAMAAFDPNVTKWLQGSLNALLDPSPMLEVDGIYGPMTRAAVERLQAKLGLVVDGFAGRVTQAAIEAVLSKKPQLN